MTHKPPSRDENDGPTGFPRKGFVVGVLLWLLFCLLAVAVRGVRWDENYEFAQVILGQIVYPEGHPLLQCIGGVYSLQTQLLVALMWLVPDPLVANGSRNLLFLLATVLPAFTVGFTLTRRAVWGHVSALLALLGVHVLLFSSYPIQTWPDLYSTGHVATGYGLTALALFALGFRRTAAFMLGLMVAVHLGQLPPLLALFALYLALAWREGRHGECRRSLVWVAWGLLPSLLLWLLLRGFAVTPPEAGPYFSPIAADDVWRGYMTHHLSHRMIPWTNGHFALAGFLLLGVARAWSEYDSTRERGPWFWLTAYAAACALPVWGVMALHGWLGAEVPFVLVSWMPYRLMNHVSILLVPAVVAAVAGRRSAGLPLVNGFALLLGLAGLLVAGPMRAGNLGPGSISFLSGGEGILFGLYGAAAALTALRLSSRPRLLVPWIVLLSLLWILVAVFYQGLFESAIPDWAADRTPHVPPFYQAACAAAGFVLALGLSGRKYHPSLRHVAAALSGLLVVVMLVHAWMTREPLRSDFDDDVRRYLEDRGAGEAMILVRHQQESAQARLGHPVMTDMGAFNWIPYKPSVGPSQYKMYKDLYGVNFAPRGDEHPVPLLENGRQAPIPEALVWPARSRQDWRDLGETYGFRWIIAPRFMPLDLPVGLAGADEVLYDIEAGEQIENGSD